jgi:hypothetical protein
MRRVWSHLFPLISILLSFSALSYGQGWSGILASSRAMNWGNAGLPANFPDGETTPNPWTPPTRTQCGSTISSGASPATINAALAACPTGTYVLLGAGTFAFSNANLTLFAQNGVTLRGSGAQSTKLVLTGTSVINFGQSWSNGSCSWTSGYSVGSTSLTAASCTGASLVPGQLVALRQCDTGYSGSNCGSGSATDNGGLFVCGYNTTCDTDGGGSGEPNNQQQIVYVTSVTGTGPYTVTFTPGIYMPNWSSSQSPTISWTTTLPSGPTASPYGNGLEDLTVDLTQGITSNSGINLTGTYASWIKGVRILGIGKYLTAYISGKNCLFANNYMFGTTSFNGVFFLIQEGGDSDNLVINNIMAGGTPWEGEGSTEGNVIAYNYGRYAQSSGYFNRLYQHVEGSAFILYEGNEIGQTEDDDTWGTHDLNTWFRNYVSGWDPPFQTTTPTGMTLDSFSRFENAIGNAIGSAQLTNYQSTYSSQESAFVFGLSLASNDTLTISSAMRWGNCDTVTATCRFVSSEVPTTLPGNAAPFENLVPSSQTLPCSFFLAGYNVTGCNSHPSGGTGLSWWQVCTAWTTFPASCSATQVEPFPLVGPDVSGGPYVNGTAYDIPAALASNNLPTDPTYQGSYNITGSTWSGGTETLSVSGLPSGSMHIMGGFQLSGAPAACSPTSGVSYTGRPDGEVLMTGSSTTTISYALAPNPGTSCTGTMKWPDIRQFDERVYQNDPSGAQAPQAPSGLQAVVH